MDDFERRIKAARPTSGHRDLPLTDRAKRELAELLIGDLPPARTPMQVRPRVPRELRVVVTVVALLIAIGVPTVLLGSSSSAHAAAPPLLVTTPIAGTAADQLRILSRAARESPDLTGGKVTHIEVEAWVLGSEVGEEDVLKNSVVQPNRYDITRLQDGTMRHVITAGAPRGSSTEGAVPEGTVISDTTWTPDECCVFVGSVPEDAALIPGFVVGDLDDPTVPNSAESLELIGDLLLEQELNPAQNSAILEYLAVLPDLALSGRVVDRLGREGVVFSAWDVDHPEYREHLIVSPDTGRILASERTYHGTTRTDIDSPSVIRYFAWR